MFSQADITTYCARTRAFINPRAWILREVSQTGYRRFTFRVHTTLFGCRISIASLLRWTVAKQRALPLSTSRSIITC